MTITGLCVSLLGSGLTAASAEPPLPYDPACGQWLLDAESIVSRNDVLYTTPSESPYDAMPTGGGDLSAMVRWDGSLRIHLTKSDCWGFQAPPESPQGSRFFNNVSPGHVRLTFGSRAQSAAAARFRQRLDLYHGAVVVELGEAPNQATLRVWGHPKLRVLVVDIDDPAGLLEPAVELSEWRDTMRVGQTASRQIWAREVQPRPARPHLANTGMDDYFPPGEDPLQGRGTAVVVASADTEPAGCSAQGLTATMTLAATQPGTYRILIAASVTARGEPLDAARAELRRALAIEPAQLAREHGEWWRDYWSRSFIALTSPDRAAEWLTAAYHVHLYTLGCTNRGPVPAKWDGGAGLMVEDQRNWGISEWVQEVRFTFLPLYAANRLEMARGFSDFYSCAMPYLAAQTERMWGPHGLWIPETIAPWGHAEDFALGGEGSPPLPDYFHRWDPETAPYGRFRGYNPYIGFLFTAGLEACWHYLQYYRYSGDEAFLREQAYPVLKGVSQFVTSLMRRGEDGRYHLDPANALETWWMVRDPSDTLDGLRAILPEFIALSARYGLDEDVRRRCRDVLAGLPEPSRGLWREDGSVDLAAEVYAPAAAPGRIAGRVNAENPQLYRVFPFGLSGIGTADQALAERTFAHRICPLNHGWSMDAIWAARLGLSDQACALLAQHARQFNRFRYGGWDSNDSNVGPDGLAAAPFLDAGGLSAFALQEILLQSHGGIIRVAPALDPSWSGVFRLRAEGGFLVAADISEGTVRLAEVTSLWGRECTLANPWPEGCAVASGGQQVLRTSEPLVRFQTRAGEVHVLESLERPASSWSVGPLRTKRNEMAGLPGRDAAPE